MMDIVVLLPKGRCTKIQQLQMTTVHDENVHNFVVDGTSDDLDVPIKKIFADTNYVKKHNLCSINSINWARILVQVKNSEAKSRNAKKESSPSRILNTVSTK
jgi:threonine synthase